MFKKSKKEVINMIPNQDALYPIYLMKRKSNDINSNDIRKLLDHGLVKLNVISYDRISDYSFASESVNPNAKYKVTSESDFDKALELLDDDNFKSKYGFTYSYTTVEDCLKILKDTDHGKFRLVIVFHNFDRLGHGDECIHSFIHKLTKLDYVSIRSHVVDTNNKTENHGIGELQFPVVSKKTIDGNYTREKLIRLINLNGIWNITIRNNLSMSLKIQAAKIINEDGIAKGIFNGYIEFEQNMSENLYKYLIYRLTNGKGINFSYGDFYVGSTCKYYAFKEMMDKEIKVWDTTLNTLNTSNTLSCRVIGGMLRSMNPLSFYEGNSKELIVYPNLINQNWSWIRLGHMTINIGSMKDYYEGNAYLLGGYKKYGFVENSLKELNGLK